MKHSRLQNQELTILSSSCHFYSIKEYSGTPFQQSKKTPRRENSTFVKCAIYNVRIEVSTSEYETLVVNPEGHLLTDPGHNCPQNRVVAAQSTLRFALANVDSYGNEQADNLARNSLHLSSSIIFTDQLTSRAVEERIALFVKCAIYNVRIEVSTSEYETLVVNPEGHLLTDPGHNCPQNRVVAAQSTLRFALANVDSYGNEQADNLARNSLHLSSSIIFTDQLTSHPVE
ncbi:hypothetical protein TNCV_2132211 [Trichonephila clavipes]|nr:hypothetical protein TNCV_2132211 [Trichonephila clavipes]